MKKTYTAPHCNIVVTENTIMQTFSTQTTNAGDDSQHISTNGNLEGGDQNEVPECSKKGFFDDWGGSGYDW